MGDSLYFTNATKTDVRIARHFSQRTFPNASFI